jgi:hypothetical protein
MRPHPFGRSLILVALAVLDDQPWTVYRGGSVTQGRTVAQELAASGY